MPMGRDSRDLMRELEADGWRCVGATGSHRHYKHPTKPGKVTVPHPKGLASKDCPLDLQAGRIEGATVRKTTGYIALVHKDKDTSYGVSFPDLPGCISAGDTFEEAIENASQALAGHLAVMEADGDPVPHARSLEELEQDAGFVDDSIDAVVAFVLPQGDQVTVLQPAS
jgi:predicted RNase H-like HicB family nuclease/predicted RNA binding protein YcfA (HicA-like mRNA interferase family)